MSKKKDVLNKVLRIQIHKPISTDWKTLESVFNQLRAENSKIFNRAIQLAWEDSTYRENFKLNNPGQDIPKDSEIYGCSFRGYVYRVITNEFRLTENKLKLASGNVAYSIRLALKEWKTHKDNSYELNMSIPSHKPKGPIYLRGDSIENLEQTSFTITKDEGEEEISNDYVTYNINLRIINKEFSKTIEDDFGKRCNVKLQLHVDMKKGGLSQLDILGKIYRGEYKMTTGQIIEKGGKWNLYLGYEFKKSPPSPGTNVMGIDLGVRNAVYMAYRESYRRNYIKGDEIQKFRRQIEWNKRYRQKNLVTRGEGSRGHGRKVFTRPAEKFKRKIANFRDLTNHKYSKWIVEQAVKENVGVIVMENLTGITEDKKDTFLGQWTYYDLQQKIKYKANEVGILVQYINPRYTSQRCSKCGHIEDKNRDGKTFKCVKCDNECDSDYNAAKNIATENIEDLIIEFHKSNDNKEELKKIKEDKRNNGTKKKNTEQMKVIYFNKDDKKEKVI